MGKENTKRAWGFKVEQIYIPSASLGTVEKGAAPSGPPPWSLVTYRARVDIVLFFGGRVRKRPRLITDTSPTRLDFAYVQLAS